MPTLQLSQYVASASATPTVTDLQNALAGMGSVGSATGSRLMTFKLRTTSATSTEKLGGAQVTIGLPAGVTLRAGSDGFTLADAVTTSVPNGFIRGSVNSGLLSVGLIGVQPAFGIGEFATLYFDVPAGTSVSATSFTPVTRVKVFDVKGAALSGIGMELF